MMHLIMITDEVSEFWLIVVGCLVHDKEAHLRGRIAHVESSFRIISIFHGMY